MYYRDNLSTLEERYETLAVALEQVKGRSKELEREGLALREEQARVAEQLEQRQPPALLTQLRIASPCSAKWEKMSGDDRVRFCGDCRKHVYNVSAMTRQEGEAFLAANSNGETCVRFFERTDGTILTSDCPVGVERKKRRKLALAIVGGTAVWGAGIFASTSALVMAAQSSLAAASSSENVVMGYIDVKGDDGVRVVVDGEIEATLPVSRITLKPGRHVIELRGSAVEKHVVDLDSGQVKTVTQTRPSYVPVPVAAYEPRPFVPVLPFHIEPARPTPTPTPGRWMAGGLVPRPAPPSVR